MANEMEGFFQELYAYDLDSIEQAVKRGGVLAEFPENDIRAERSTEVFSDKAAFKAYVNETGKLLEQQKEYREEVSETEKMKKDAVGLNKKIQSLEKEMEGIDEAKLRAGSKGWKQELDSLEARQKVASVDAKKAATAREDYEKSIANLKDSNGGYAFKYAPQLGKLATLKEQEVLAGNRAWHLAKDCDGIRTAHRVELKQLENFDHLKAWKESCAQKTQTVHQNEQAREPIEAVKQRQKDLGERQKAINAFVMEPWVKNVEEGLRSVGIEMDVAGKDKDKVLVWDRQKNSMRSAIDLALATMGKKLAEEGVTRYRLALHDNFLIKKTGEDLHIYRDSATFEPTTVTQGATGKNFALKSQTPPQPPKEPNAFYRAMDKVAKWFSGRNGTCKRYEDDVKSYQTTLSRWNVSEAFQNCKKDIAQKRKSAWEKGSEEKQLGAKEGKEVKEYLNQNKTMQAEQSPRKMEPSSQPKPKGMGM